jgi:hypothetical protein
MKKNKKALPNRSDFHKKHDPLVQGGEAQVFLGWVNAGVECFERFGGNASAYAKASVNGFAVSQTENTIRQYVGAVVTLLRKHNARLTAMTKKERGSKTAKSEMLAEYDSKYETREINALRSLVAGKGQRKAGGSKKSTQDTVALSKRKASAFVTKFVPANKRDEAMESLGF